MWNLLGKKDKHAKVQKIWFGIQKEYNMTCRKKS
ncbi:hypothetical protein ID866_8413 [Astraeus odoratus]|nr:hypothetical protein ID866_8413 [Astraeus odoratus]